VYLPWHSRAQIKQRQNQSHSSHMWLTSDSWLKEASAFPKLFAFSDCKRNRLSVALPKVIQEIDLRLLATCYISTADAGSGAFIASGCSSNPFRPLYIKTHCDPHCVVYSLSIADASSNFYSHSKKEFELGHHDVVCVNSSTSNLPVRQTSTIFLKHHYPNSPLANSSLHLLTYCGSPVHTVFRVPQEREDCFCEDVVQAHGGGRVRPVRNPL
jgi:hypothetical protein